MPRGQAGRRAHQSH